jgi:hypothetical protein
MMLGSSSSNDYDIKLDRYDAGVKSHHPSRVRTHTRDSLVLAHGLAMARLAVRDSG